MDLSMAESGPAPGRSRQLPPQDLDAEKSLLGALLLDGAAFPKIVDIALEPGDFYREANGKIFESILSLSTRGEPVDVVTLSAHLRSVGAYEGIGGGQALSALFENSYSSAHVVHYARIVKDRSTLRKVISASNEVIDQAYTGVESMDEFLDEVERSVFAVTGATTKNSIVGIRDILLGNMQRIQELSEKETTVTGLGTGFREFDRMTTGLHPGQLIVIAARPAMGKTSLALNMAQNAAVQGKVGVVVFSLEMAKEELGFRFLTGLARVNSSALKVGRLKDRDWKALTKAASVLSDAKIFIDDSAAISVLEMRSRCRRIQTEHGLGLIIVDYLQLMRGTSKPGKGSDNREREISEISRGLKSLAKELRVPVIALSQLNRGVESRTDKRPMLSDLRESGAIEQDADIVAFVYRDEVYNKDSEDKGKAEFIMAKHRSGGVGTVRLNWDAEFTAFSNEDDTTSQSYGTGYSAGNVAAGPPEFASPNAGQSGNAPRPAVGPRKPGLDLPNF